MVDLVVVLGTPQVAAEISRIVSEASEGVRVERVDTLERLEEASQCGADFPLLVSAGSGVIVPRHVLERFRAGAVNFHAATPDYPGRDPHHFAAYDQCRRYGATAHTMTERVDDGPILDVEETSVEPGAEPHEYLALARSCLIRLLARNLPRLVTGTVRPIPGLVWGTKKRTRNEFRSMCRIDPLSEEREIARRMRAVKMPGYSNAYTDIAGYRFRIDGSVPAQQIPFRHHEEDFTEAGYLATLEQVADRYQFVGFNEAMTVPTFSVLWRHDIDISVHRARRLAALEAERGLRSTYFVLPGSRFYNVFEPETRELLREIAHTGHHIGLHFDPTVIERNTGDVAAIQEELAWQGDLLQRLLDAPITAVSVHNPTSNIPWLELDVLAGFPNAYGAALRRRYYYVSDSNGIWRHRRLMDVVVQESHPYLHVLTHPVWWVPTPLRARARVRRAVEGRARSTLQNYDRGVAHHGRPNIK